MMGPYLSLVIPVFNEQENLTELIVRCKAACQATQHSFEIILVDDGSQDQSRQIISTASRIHPELVGIFLNRNYGQHAAIFAGLEYSSGEVIVTLDADLQNPPEEIPNLLLELDRGFDVVGTVRQNRQDSVFRRFASGLVNRMVQKTTGVMMSDYGCMLRAYRREIVDRMLRCAERSTFIPILANSLAGKATEIPVSHSARSGGVSKYGLLKLIALQFDLMTSMSTFPLRILSYLGAIIAAGGIGFGVLLLVLRLRLGATWAAEGVFSLFAVLFVFVGCQFLGLGLLGEYIGRIYHDVRGRPRYFVQEVCSQSQFLIKEESLMTSSMTGQDMEEYS
ncbi:MAG: glycosyltransferase [Acidobacteria bacterium]|nr:glycosyltransferase [Acidobacteriota bacterium]